MGANYNMQIVYYKYVKPNSKHRQQRRLSKDSINHVEIM